MAIRFKNIDFGTEGMKRQMSVSLGDVSGSLERMVFVAPVPCRVDYIDLISGQGVSGTSASAQMTVIAELATNSDSRLQLRGTSATGGTTNDISANMVYRLVPSANNSLTQGTPIQLAFSGSAMLSGVLVVTTYTPYIHREAR